MLFSTWSGGDYIERNYEAAAVEGRIVQIAFQGSPKANVDFRRIMLKRLHHTGSTLRSRSVPDKGAIARAIEEKVLPLIASGKVKPVMDSTFPLDRGRRRPCPHGIERPYRQDRPDRVRRPVNLPFRPHPARHLGCRKSGYAPAANGGGIRREIGANEARL